MTGFPVNVSYSQIAVFNCDLENPFNDWTDRHVAQGFCWRDQSVSFKTLIDAGPTFVEVVMATEIPALTGIRAITVPFTCQDGGLIEIASITDGQKTGVPAGRYQLLFETGFTGDENWCRFTFILNGSMRPEVLRSDGPLTLTNNLLMHSEPA